MVEIALGLGVIVFVLIYSFRNGHSDKSRSCGTADRKQIGSSGSEHRLGPADTSGPLVDPQPPHETTLTGKCYVVDGDTIRIGKVSIRLAGIDAPELEHPWGIKAKWELVRLCKGQLITAEIEPEISYDRLVATCYLPDGRDLSAEMVKLGLALDWPKFSGGKYGHLEPDGMRKRHWKAAARQRGHMHIFNK